MSDTKNALVIEEDRVIVYDDLGTDVIHDLLDFGEAGESAAKEFQQEFDIIQTRGHIMADPDEDFYQGITVVRVIKRKRDGRLFGFEYWTPVSKHGEASVESNGDENGLEFDVPDDFDWDNGYYPVPYVFLPVEPFTITGYKTIKERI